MEEPFKRIKRVIFVCTGNTCRSPMAEIFYKSLMMDEGIETISRGLVVHFPEPINPKSVKVLENHGLESDNRTSRQWKDSELDQNTLVLTMTESHKKTLIETFGEEYYIQTLKEFSGEEGDVIDPYGGTILDYEECFGEISRLVRKAAYRIIRENEAAE